MAMDVICAQLARHLPLDYLGACGRSGDAAADGTAAGAAAEGGGGRFGDEPQGSAAASARKRRALARYPFVLAFENANVSDYVSEKLWDALGAGVVPVYLGDEWRMEMRLQSALISLSFSLSFIFLESSLIHHKDARPPSSDC